MIRLKYISLLVTFGALAVAACGDDGSDTSMTSAGGSAGTATGGGGGSAGKGTGGSAGKGSGGSKASAGSANDGGANEGGGAGADSGGAGGAGGAGPEVVMCPANAVDFTAAFARAICLKQQECCSAGQTLEDCVTATKTELDLIYVDIGDSVSNERSELSCSSFDTCVGAINAADCSAWPFSNGATGGLMVDNAACRVIMTPKLAAETACGSHYECIGGYCDTTCKEFSAIDAPCTACDPIANYCFDNETEETADDVCKPRLENGESCSDAQQCQSGMCDLEINGACVAHAECVWTPPDVASCSIGGAGKNSPLGVMGTGVLLGLAALGMRRRRR